MIWKIRALDWACIIFLMCAGFVWIMGGGVSLRSMAGGAIAALIGGVALHWQDKHAGR